MIRRNRSSHVFIGLTGLGVLALLLGEIAFAPAAAIADRAASKVYISKFRKRSNLDYVQLKNLESSDVDVGGWRLSASGGEYVIPGGTTLGANGGTRTFVFPEITDNLSEQFELIDDLELPAAGELLVDRVRWGCDGGAPAPPAFPDSAALVRTPDPNFLPPQAPGDDENWWTIDLDADFGLDNNAPQPQLGLRLHINEVRIGFGSAPDSVELFNPFPAPEFVDEWFVTSAAGVSFLNGVVPPFGVSAFAIPGLDLADTFRLDLFDVFGVRIDQKAWCFGPESECFGSCPDGSSPSNGFTYETSGGSFTWFALPCTLGELNHLPNGVCDPSALPGDEDADYQIEETGWGAIKSRFRAP